MGKHPPLDVVVWSDLACFTRPECKVERVSYPMMTPSAARGVLEAIFWRPEMRWLVREIHVLREIRWLSILRNEINSRQSIKSAVVRKGAHYCADSDRSQRHTLALRDVRYRIIADIELNEHALLDEAKEPPNEAKFGDQFHRRIARGQCFHRPYLGCREFACGFDESCGDDQPLASLNMEIGPMLFDIRYQQIEVDSRRLGSGGEPLFFEAALIGGKLKVPEKMYKEVEPVCC